MKVQVEIEIEDESFNYLKTFKRGSGDPEVIRDAFVVGMVVMGVDPQQLLTSLVEAVWAKCEEIRKDT